MHNPPRILIADDHEHNRDILATQLATQDYELFEAVDGEEALTVARAQLPDLILLDVMMPKLDGVEVCRRLKSDPGLPFMPIILVTAKSDTDDVIVGLEAGASRISDQAHRPAGAGGPGQIGPEDQGASRPGAGASRRTRRVEPHARAAGCKSAVGDRTHRPPEAVSPPAGRQPHHFVGRRPPAGEPPRRHHGCFVRPAQLHLPSPKLPSPRSW